MARALAQEPEILLLDEPTSNLDIRYQLEVMELLHDLSRSKQILVVMAVHDLNLAARYSDVVVMLHRQRIHHEGSPEQVLTAGNIREVYQVEVQVMPGVGGRLHVVPLRPEPVKAELP
jgi:iron complex transport system ATP-binding protein